MLPMLILLFGPTSVSTGGLKKAIAVWYFSLLAGDVTGERAQPVAAQAKNSGNSESANEQGDGFSSQHR